MSEDDNKKSAVGAVYYSVDKLSAGGKALINVVSSSGSRLYNDISPVLVAWAEAKSGKIKVANETELENQNLKNAGMRMIAKAARADENVMKTVALAAESIPENVPKENIKEPDVDWMTSWAEYAGGVSEEQVQSLWAGILAEKVQKTGSFPLRTLSIVRDMDKDAAEKFINFCQFVTDPVGNFSSINPLIYDATHNIYKNQGLSYSLLHEMMSMGLLTQWTHYNTRDSKEQLFSYRGDHVIVQLKHNESLGTYLIEMGESSLTQAGKDLFSLIRKSHEAKNDEFWEYVQKKWKDDGLEPRKISTEEVNEQLKLGGFPPLK